MITTILTIPKDERGSIEEICTTLDLKVDFFTDESNDEVLLARFHESDPSYMYRIGRLVGIRKIDKFINKPSL